MAFTPPPGAATAPPPRIMTGEAFVNGFVPPNWLVDGIVQQGRLYACTSLTSHGKTAAWLFIACMVHAGRMVGSLEVTKGAVLYLAGENPEDIRQRMIGMAKAFNIELHALPYVMDRAFPMNDDEADTLKAEITALGIDFVLIVGDTAASFFPGDDENDNVQAGTYARTLRSFCQCLGNPAIVVLAHPVKNASRQNLLPRGGGAFLNELDGNLTLWSESLGELTTLHWQGKIRGPDFAPLGFRLKQIDTGYVDNRDRPVLTIVAEPVPEEVALEQGRKAMADEDVVLKALNDEPGISQAQLANRVGWLEEDGTPNRKKVWRAVEGLRADKLVQQERAKGPWTLTEKGKKMLNGSGATHT